MPGSLKQFKAGVLDALLDVLDEAFPVRMPNLLALVDLSTDQGEKLRSIMLIEL
jgi:hypothetical protein